MCFLCVSPSADATADSGQGSSAFSEAQQGQPAMSFTSSASQQPQLQGLSSSQAPYPPAAYPQQPMVSDIIREPRHTASARPGKRSALSPVRGTSVEFLNGDWCAFYSTLLPLLG